MFLSSQQQALWEGIQGNVISTLLLTCAFTWAEERDCMNPPLVESATRPPPPHTYQAVPSMSPLRSNDFSAPNPQQGLAFLPIFSPQILSQQAASQAQVVFPRPHWGFFTGPTGPGMNYWCSCHWSKVTQLVHGRAWFPTAKPTPFGQRLPSAGKDFCLPPIFWKAGCQQQISSNAMHLFLGEWGRSTLQRTEKEKTEEQNECLSHQEGEASFSPEPHTPEGRNPVRGSEFHENEPQSLHRLIQISQLHISESLPHPSKPQPQVLTLCPHLCLLAQNRGRS
ncbi:hypothetical protein VULLAG_LOCUS1916 [Vulpes lagopus]